MFNLSIHKLPALLFGLLSFLTALPAGALGPVFLEKDETVSIYRDFDNGLYGRSEYRGVVFSVKLKALRRYRSMAPPEGSELTVLLLSEKSARLLAEKPPRGIKRVRPVPGNPENWIYRLKRDGIEIEFSLEAAPKELFAEIQRTYPQDSATAAAVSESYRNGSVIRVWLAENVYRPEFSFISYEDVLLSAALIADSFQPLWGIHDGNNLIQRMAAGSLQFSNTGLPF